MDLDVTSERVIERFWAKVQRGPMCWEWAASRDKDGYGNFNIAHNIRERAHRFSYARFVGPIPDGAYVLHRCDNPACVRPGHLFTGSAKDNYEDSKGKGRRVVVRGESHWASRLSADAVRKIRSMVRAGHTQRSAARAFGIGPDVVSRIVNRKAWAHVR